MSIITTDPVADMLTRIRNAINVQKTEVLVPHSKFKESIAKLLSDSNFLSGVKVVDEPIGKMIQIVITSEGSNPKITEITRMSSPGRRVYASSDKIPKVKGGRGIVIVSTSKGLMSDVQARQQKLGGELICKVY